MLQMQGSVTWYDPTSRRGRLTTPQGQSFPFTLPESTDDVGGGDLVGFQLAPAEAQKAVNVHVTQNAVDYLNDRQRDLVNRFHSVVAIQR